MTEETNNLEQRALKRQERLKSLKRKRQDNTPSDSDKAENGNDATNLPRPKFRSYKPQDKGLTEHLVQQQVREDVQTEVKDLLDLAKNEVVIDQLDIATLAPRQPDWDLKRDVEKKLEKLSRRTQKAMAELIRDKLKEKQDLSQVPDD